jgi:hypothetical protein
MTKKIGTLLARVKHRIRVGRLNRRPGVKIALRTYIAKSAMIQTDSDGCSFGGRILVSDGVTISDGVIIATYPTSTIASLGRIFILPCPRSVSSKSL